MSLQSTTNTRKTFAVTEKQYFQDKSHLSFKDITSAKSREDTVGEILR